MKLETNVGKNPGENKNFVLKMKLNKKTKKRKTYVEFQKYEKKHSQAAAEKKTKKLENLRSLEDEVAIFLILYGCLCSPRNGGLGTLADATAEGGFMARQVNFKLNL